MKTFKDYLKNIHAGVYQGLDDDMPDDFDNWVSLLDSDEIIQLAEEYGRELQNA